MDNNQLDIERYLDELMTSQERKDFEAKMTRDKTISQQLEMEQLARSFTKEAGRLDLKETLEIFDNEGNTSSRSNKAIPLWVRRALPIAAMIVIFALVYHYQDLNRNVSTSQVFNDYFEMYESPSIVRDVTTKVPSWEKGVQYYNEGNYTKALVSFSNAEEEMPSYMISFYKAMCALGKDPANYSMAEEQFLIVQSTDNDYRQQAMWYRGLVLLKMGDKEKAFAIFNDIIEKESFGYKKAEKIITIKIKE